MSSDQTKVIYSFCITHAKNWALFLVDDEAKAGDIFRITRGNLEVCFNEDQDILDAEDSESKRVGVTYLKHIAISGNPDDDFLLFTFDEDAGAKDTFMLTYSLFNSLDSSTKKQF